MSFIRILMFLLLFSPLMSFAQEKQLPLDKIDEMQKLDSLTNKLDQLGNIADSISKEKYYKCLKAFGNGQFCRCLSDNIPIRVSFEDYIVIVTSTRDQLSYKDRSDDDKKMINHTYKARDMCVYKEKNKKSKRK